VLCPDLRGAGWSSAPGGRYRKADMADALAHLLDQLGVDKVALVAHDWGGPIAFLTMLRHPQRVTGYFGVNTTSPRLQPDLGTARHLWRFWYQIPIALPVVGPYLIGDQKARYLRLVDKWVGGGFGIPREDFWGYVHQMREPGHAVAGSRWYRTFLTREFGSWMAGEFKDVRVGVPVRWLMGTADPVLTTSLLRGYNEWIDDFDVETVDGVGHWFPEQRPDLLLDRLRTFLGSL
jgi:pimeloyl-ACP methyl ester carboxylesterase